ncbi:MAG TPA: kelch repeat-containing protein [Pyrinomonadaceae bacterium]|nr:kelch repeat-containing protein [Pyrinomonadaceae bacterium]
MKSNLHISLLGTTLLALLINSPAQIQAQQANWSTTGSLGSARVLHTATLLTNGKVLTAGGLIVGNLTTDSAELYDPATGMWSATGSMIGPRLNHMAVRLLNGKVLVAGGARGTTTFKSAELYDPDTGTWSTTGNMAVARTIGTATLLSDGKVLAAGGSGDNTAELYDPVTGTWSLTGTMNAVRESHAATVLPNGKVLVSGGFTGSFSNPTLHSSAELYDPATGSWTPTGSLNTARAFLMAILLLNGKVLAVGGGNFTFAFKTAELYDPATGQWSTTGSMLTARDSSSTLTLLASGKVLVVGNVLGQKSAELYDPASGSWTATADLHSTVRLNHEATLLLNGKVLVSGGNGPLSSAELFDSGEPTSTIQFSSASFNVGENAGQAVITVTRTGDISAQSSVDFATANSDYVPCNTFNGIAVQNCDFTLASGKLTFNANETSKAFTVFVTDDLHAEGNEVLNLFLSNQTIGVVLSGQNTTTLTIADNDSSVPTTNPLDDANAQFFVRQHYLDFLNREPDPAGFAHWTNEISSCGSDQLCVNARRIRVSDAFFFEPEYQESAAFVFRVYRASFGTTDGYRPTYGEFQPDRSSVIGGPQLDASKATFTNAFVQRLTFLAIYPVNQPAQDYVNALNAHTGNSLTGAEVAALVSGLMGGTETRGSVLRKVADNHAFIDREYNRTFAANLYYGYLRREPETGGYEFWLGQVNRFPLRDPDAQHGLVCSFITSAEYQNRFSSAFTHSNGECPQ